jgi:hypothetical protein
MLSGHLYNLEDYFQKGHEVFDLFIGSVSFEKRCIGAISIMKKFAQQCPHVYVFDYKYLLPISSFRNETQILENRKVRLEQQEQNKYILASILEQNAQFINVEITNPFSDIHDFIGEFMHKEFKIIKDAERICIDISTLTKPFFFLIIKMILQNFNKKHIFVINTIPSKYSSSSLSFNIWGTEIMSSYNGIWKPQNRNALIAMLGFEGHKLRSILTKWDFPEVIPIIGFPAFHPGLQDRTLLANVDELKRTNAISKIKYAPALDPFQTYMMIEDILNKYSGNYNVAIAPLGPKPMALAAALLSIKYNLRIVYSFPQEYSPSYSTQIGESYLHEIEMI